MEEPKATMGKGNAGDESIKRWRDTGKREVQVVIEVIKREAKQQEEAQQKGRGRDL